MQGNTTDTTLNTDGPGDVVAFVLTGLLTNLLTINDNLGLGTVQFNVGAVTSGQVALSPNTDVSVASGSFAVVSPVTAADAYVSAGNLTVAAAQTLSVTGKVGLTGGTAYVAGGTISDSGTFTQSGTNVLSIDLDVSMATPVVASGTITLGGILQLNPASGFNPSPGTIITLIHNAATSSSPVVGQFQGLPEGAVIPINNVFYTLSYDGGTDAQDVVLTVDSPPTAGVPIANYFTVQMGQGQTTSINLVANASGGNGSPLVASIVSSPAQGSVAYNATTGLYDYTPTSSTYTGPDSFTDQVTDGTNVSDVVTVAVMVNPINHAPMGTNNTVSVSYGNSYTFATTDFGFSDANDSPANQFSAVEITTLPSGGTLTDNGRAVTTGQFVSLSDIINGLLLFTPAINGAGTTSFTFQVQDDGGTAYGGVDTDTTAKTMTITISQATPIFMSLSDGGPYNGSANAATATIAGVLVGVDNTPSGSLEGIGLTLTYYAGTDTSGTPLAGAPSQVGTYTVVAAFAGSTDYVSATKQVTLALVPISLWLTANPLTTTISGYLLNPPARAPTPPRSIGGTVLPQRARLERVREALTPLAVATLTL